MAGLDEKRQQVGILEEGGMEEIGDREYDVAVGNAWEEATADEIGPVLGIGFGAGKAERGFTGKSDLESVATLRATILGIAHGVGIAARDHFLDDGVVVIGIVTGILGDKSRPVVGEDELKGGFVNMIVERKFGHGW